MANGVTTENQVNVTTPLGFFSNTIEPTFNQDIFSEDNLSEEVQKPDLTSPLVLRDNVMKAAGDEDLSLTEFDAAANLARQTLLSDLSSQDIYTRSKRDLQFNIGAERDIQFQQGRQLLSDIDAFIESQRATVVQREYEKELKRQEELLKEEKKEQLQLMAMKMGIDPDGMSRKELRSAIAGKSAEVEAYSRSRSGGGSGSGGSGGCPTGFFKNSRDGKCYPKDVVQYVGMIQGNEGTRQNPLEGIDSIFGTNIFNPIQGEYSQEELAKILYGAGYDPSAVSTGVETYAGYVRPYRDQSNSSSGGSLEDSGGY